MSRRSANCRCVFKKNERNKKRSFRMKLLLVGGAYETRTRDPMRDRHVF